MIDILQKSVFNPQELINCLKSMNNLDEVYQQKVRHYTLERHTLLVMNEFERHFSQIDLPTNKNLFRLMLALHDIRKPKAFLEGNKNNQYAHTIEIINGLRISLPFTNLEVDLCISLVSTDTLGMYLQGQINLETAKKHIIALANRTNLSVLAFFRLITIYYQCDIASYTADAGGLAYLEHLFVYQNSSKVFDKANNRLKFSTNFEVKFLELEKSLSL